MKSSSQITKLFVSSLFTGSVLKKEFTIKDGQIARVNLRKCWTRYEKGRKYNGHCIKSGKELIGFFVFDRRIFVFINNNVFDVEDVKISNELIGENRTLTMAINGKILFERDYLAETGYDVNLTWTTEEEDVDDFLWISNVLNNIERREVMLKSCIDSKVAQ
jgi:hypothetical protein